MSISADNIERNIKFLYENENNTDDNYWVVYSDTPTGPVVRFTKDGGSYYEFSLKMLTEVLDFLRSSVITEKGGEITADAISYRKNTVPDSSAPAIVGTAINRKNSKPKTGVNVVQQEQPATDLNTVSSQRPVESFGPRPPVNTDAVEDNSKEEQESVSGLESNTVPSNDEIINRPVRTDHSPNPVPNSEKSIKRK